MSFVQESAGSPPVQPATKRSRRGSRRAEGVKVIERLAPRASLVEQVVERVRSGIYSGEFPPGSELPAEGKLAEMVGVSYTVMREAMRTLRSQGLVEISQGRRPRIKPAGPDAVRETLDAMLRRSGSSIRALTELRRPLEYEMAALAAQRATPAHIAQIEQSFARQRAAKTLDEQIQTDIEFHNQVAAAAGNPLFGLVLSILCDLLCESLRRGILHNGSDSSWTGHRALLAAIQHHDAAAAREAMREHLTGFEDFWQESDSGDVSP